MTTLHIEFTRSTKKFPVFSWLIRLVQRTPYSHVRLRWINSTQTPVIYEASGSSVKFIGPIAQQKLQAETIHSFSYELTREQYRQLVKICMTYAGVQYSIPQIIKIGLLSFGIGKGKFTKDGEYAQICSELVARVLQTLNFRLNLDPDTAGPRELYEVIRDFKEIIDGRNIKK